MKTAYRVIGWLGAISAVLEGVSHLISISRNDPKEEVLLRSISIGVYVIVTLLAFGNAERLERKS